MNNSYRRTLADIDIILSGLDEETRNKVPKQFRDLIHNDKLEGYESNIRMDIPLEHQTLHPDTQAFMAMLYLKYWCESDEEKQNIMATLNDNERKYQQQLSEKYSYENLFKNTKKEDVVQKQEPVAVAAVATTNMPPDNRNNQLVEYKESFIKRILDKIFSFFRRK